MTVIRKATADDEAGVIDLLRQLLFPAGATRSESTYDWQSVATTLREVVEDTAKGTVLVAEDDGDLIGAITLSYPTAIRYSGIYACIEEFITSPKARGKGVGSQLLETAIAEAASKGCNEVQVNNPTEAGYPVYLRQGFKDIGKHLKLRLPHQDS